jgi:hypothetical protein
MVSLEFSVGETLIFNILKDSGFIPKNIGRELKRGLRFMPCWEADEYKKGISVYHPVRRKTHNLFRRMVGIMAGYEKPYQYLPAIFFYRLYRKIVRRKPEKEEGWFNP